MSANLVPKELVKDLLHTKVFYYHSIRGWEVGTIQNLSVLENRAGVTQVILSIRSTDDDQLSDLIYKPSLLMKCSGGADTLSPDNLLTLPELHNGVLVNALKLRHRKDVMYTNLGELVVAINPFKYSIPHYQDSCMAAYLACLHQVELPPSLLPHPWAVAHRAYASMMSIGTNHSIIISGESGSGKTESCKTMIKYLCHVSETVSSKRRQQQQQHHEHHHHYQHHHPRKPPATPSTTASTPTGAGPLTSTTHGDGADSSMSGIIDRVQLSNLVLEAFGNAKTLRNDNSSRFGKLTEVQFSESGQLVGMRTTPFLLERSRVVHCALDERVFHCFYQLAAGGSKELLAELRIRSARDFQLLGQGKCISLKASGVDDAADFKKVNAALEALNFSSEERHAVWRVVAAVAHLQNVQFVDHASQFGRKSSEEAEVDPGSIDTVHFVARDLLRLPDPQSLLQSLVESSSMIKGQGAIVRKLSTQKALDQRDSISKLLYSKLFLWLVDRINAATECRAPSSMDEAAAAGGEEGGPDMTPKSWIALLDIFGFEDFPNNSFEQFCINLANESLQRHYTQHHFIRDLEDMKKEGITTQRVTFVDNGPCVELLQGQKNSVIAALDECSTLDLERGTGNATNPNVTFLGNLTKVHRPEYQSSGPKAGGKSVLDRHGSGVNDSNDPAPLEKPSDYFFRGRLDDDTFTIRHYACDVKYKIDGFVEKNMDHVRESSVATIRTTTDDVLQQMLSVDENIGLLQDLQSASPGSPRGGGGASSPNRGPGGGPPGGAGKRTVASQFRASLKLLMDTLDQTSPHWVRCIRPHARKAPNLFDGKLVLEQLVATGILATIEQRQRNFPYRVPHVEFVQRFGVLASSSLRRLGVRSTNQERSVVIISALRQAAAAAVVVVAAPADASSPSASPQRQGAAAVADDANIQVGHTKVFLSSTAMLQLERRREALLDQHVMCLSAFGRTYAARKVTCKIIWTMHTIKMQRLARRALRIRRAVKAYYAELRKRIIDRHLQEQRDAVQVESRARPRILMEEQTEFHDTSKTFRSLLAPMITTVLKNIRAVESTTRQEVAEQLQQAYWRLEAHFAEGVTRAHELRAQRLKEERERKQHMLEVFWQQHINGRSRLVEMEATERAAMMTDRILPHVRVIQAAAARIQQQQRERDVELQRLRALRDVELRRLQRAEERRIDGERDLWRAGIGEASYLTDLAQWRGAPPGEYEAFMRHFCAARLPSKLLPGGSDVMPTRHADPSSPHRHASSVSDVAASLFQRYRHDLLQRAGGDTSVFTDASELRKVVLRNDAPLESNQVHHQHHNPHALARVALASPLSPVVRRRTAVALSSVAAQLSPSSPLHAAARRHGGGDAAAARPHRSSTASAARSRHTGDSSDDELEFLRELDQAKLERRHPSGAQAGSARRPATAQLLDDIVSSSSSDDDGNAAASLAAIKEASMQRRSSMYSPPQLRHHGANTAAAGSPSTQHRGSGRGSRPVTPPPEPEYVCGGLDRMLFHRIGR